MREKNNAQERENIAKLIDNPIVGQKPGKRNYLSRKISECLRLGKPIFGLSTKHDLGNEGKIVTGRNISAYEVCLRFEKSVLKDKKVLNFGCGGSNLRQELKNKRVSSNVVDLDLVFDPVDKSSLLFRCISGVVDHVRRKVGVDSPTYYRAHKIRKFLCRTRERNFAQGDGRNLPFPDKTFDVTLALQSTYQIPLEAKQDVFKELLRVSDIMHLGPIFKKDFDLLNSLLPETNHEIVCCHPISLKEGYKNNPFLPRKGEGLSYYQKYINSYSQENRVIEPTKDNVSYRYILGHPIIYFGSYSKGGSYIILRRKPTKNH